MAGMRGKGSQPIAKDERTWEPECTEQRATGQEDRSQKVEAEELQAERLGNELVGQSQNQMRTVYKHTASS
jgi:hypothetical protein